MNKKSILLTQIVINILGLSTFFIIGSKNFLDNYLWIFIYNYLVLVFPILISWSIRNTVSIDLKSLLYYLIYPVLFFLFITILQKTNVSTEDLKNIYLIIFIISFNFFILLNTVLLSTNQLNKIKRNILYLLIPYIILSILFVLVRDQDSIISLDYLQHNAVVNQSINNKEICIVPNQCSNLFLQIGYTTFYHSILSFLTYFSGSNVYKTLYVIDLTWMIFLYTIIFYTYKKLLSSKTVSALASLFAVLVFTNGSYETVFFLPQTLAFVFFLFILNEKNITFKKLILAGIILVLTHFIIGIFLLFLLFIKYIYINHYLKLQFNITKTVSLLSIATLVLTLTLHISNFSFEESFQLDSLRVIGSTTNLKSPESIWFILSLLGFNTVILVFSILKYYQTKKVNDLITYSLIILCICTSAYFVGPTYANKFLIGFGFFSTLIIFYTVNKFFSKKMLIIATILLFLSIVPIYLTNYKNYSNFYNRNKSTESAITEIDKSYISVLKENDKLECILISDPLTQIHVSGLTNYETVQAQYMSLEARKKLYRFITKPNESNYIELENNIKTIEEDKKICILLTNRLTESSSTFSNYWTQNIYAIYYEKENEIANTEIILEFLQNKNYTVVEQDTNYILLTN